MPQRRAHESMIELDRKWAAVRVLSVDTEQMPVQGEGCVRDGTEPVRPRTHMVVAVLSAVCTAPSSAADCCDDGTESFLYLHTKY
jgi:hypothetical protein